MRLAVKFAFGVLLLGLAVLTGTALFVRFVTAGYLYDELGALPAHDVALVPGASVFRSGKPSPVVEARLRAAQSLLANGKVDKILVSGTRHGDYDEADAMRTWLVRAGVDEGKIAIDQAGLRTLDSVVRASSLFGVKRLIVCTQAFHLPRAVFLARRAGIDAIGLKAGGSLAETGFYDLARESLATVRALIDARRLPPLH